MEKKEDRDQQLEEVLLEYDVPRPDFFVDIPRPSAHEQGEQLWQKVREMLQHNYAVNKGIYAGTPYTTEDFEIYC